MALEQIESIRQNASDGDFQAQKYMLQNVDDTYSDRKETVNKYEFDVTSLPKLDEIFHDGSGPIIDRTFEAPALDVQYQVLSHYR